MPKFSSFERPVQPNWEGLVDNILRKGTPDRVYHIENGVATEVGAGGAQSRSAASAPGPS